MKKLWTAGAAVAALLTHWHRTWPSDLTALHYGCLGLRRDRRGPLSVKTRGDDFFQLRECGVGSEPYADSSGQEITSVFEH